MLQAFQSIITIFNNIALNKMSGVKERLIEFLDYKNVSKSEFGRRIGVSSAFVTSIRKSIQPDKILAIQSNFSDLNTDWLLTGNGEMLKKSAESTAKLLGGVYSAIEGDEGVVMIDYVPATATATFIEYVGDGNPELDKIAVLKQSGESLDGNYKVFEVIGESMSPAIPNRAKILTRNIAQSKWEQAEGVVVVVFGDEVVVKRIINNDLAINNSLVLSSDNPKFGERRIALADIRAMYKAIRIVSADIL